MTDRERDPAEFGRRLQSAMDERGWSEREMGRRADVSPQTIANMLAGHKKDKPDEPYTPTRSTLRKVALALAEDVDDWLQAAGYFIPPAARKPEEPDPEMVDHLVRVIPQLDRPVLEALVILVDRSLRAKGYVGPDIGRRGVDIVSPDGTAMLEIKSYPGQPADEDVVSGSPRDGVGPARDDDAHGAEEERADQAGR